MHVETIIDNMTYYISKPSWLKPDKKPELSKNYYDRYWFKSYIGAEHESKLIENSKVETN